MNDGQLSLFALYDFNIIPVELISNIYEILLGREARAKDNAFYTPNFLVEYILDKTTLGFLKEHNKYTILDPACGFRVIIVIEANSYVNTRSSRLLPKFKTQKINSWCAA
ncbi:TPA: N-6 DNA methylase [Streptococcus agalactiae]